MSPGPTGVDGLTMTTGRPRSSISSRTTSSAWNFDRLYGPIMSAALARRLLVGDAAREEAEGRDAAGVDDALDPGCQRRQHQFAGALDIGAEHRRRVGHPDPVIGRDVEHIAAARRPRRQRCGVLQRALGDLDVQTCEVAPVAVRPGQHPHRLAAAQQRARHRRSDKPGRSGHEAQPRGKRPARYLALTRIRHGAIVTKPGVRRTPRLLQNDASVLILLREAGEVASAASRRGRPAHHAPSTTLRVVPLPRVAGEEPFAKTFAIDPVTRRP